jgi:uncharacterized membrane protein YkvA (DUF1232 family)
MFKKIRTIGKKLRNEIEVYKLLIKDKRTPKAAKILLGLAMGYFFLPFDLIPDFIPVIGHLDDAIIIPALVFLALKMIPKELVDECRKKAMIYKWKEKTSLA